MQQFKGLEQVKRFWRKASGMFSPTRFRKLKAEDENNNAPIYRQAAAWFKSNKVICLKSAGALSLFAVVAIGGHQYVEANTHDVYQVYVGNKQAGTVNDPQVVESFVINRYNQVQKEHPNVHMLLNSDQIHYKSEKAFKAESDNKSALNQLDRLLTATAVGVELKVNGKLVAYVKDQETANQILNNIKSKFTPNLPQAKSDKKVSILSVSTAPAKTPSSELKSVDFVQKVDTETTKVDPSRVMNPADVIRKLETGDVQPTEYIVKEGDCVSCIAQKFGISVEQLYKKNPWIVDDMIHIGDELDLTVLQPTLSVQTVETLVEDQDIQYTTTYQKDSNMRAGQTRLIRAGKDGMKKVTYELTKINGEVVREEYKDEVVIVKPVPAVAIKGTKVVLGEGTGAFAWPVSGARITSPFGERSGVLHKGVDLVSSNRSILAADNGKVSYAGVKHGYGNVVIIDHQNGYETLYGHLSRISVKSGQVVEKGEKIGVMGNTGDSDGVHLHFEVHNSGKLTNPLRYLQK